jgi:hypothetical protein
MRRASASWICSTGPWPTSPRGSSRPARPSVY